MDRSLLTTVASVLVACAITFSANAGATGQMSSTSVDKPSAKGDSVPPPVASPAIREILKGMAAASTEGHPDLFGEFAGTRRLFEGKYDEALKYFKYGARFADKPSQLSIAMMYLNGRGVEKDPATACAWLTLAAERGVPAKYVMVRKQVCGSLLPVQHDRAVATLAALTPVYGDTAAQDRMKLALLGTKRNMTGSRVGSDVNVTVQGNSALSSSCSTPALNVGGVTVPREGCGRFAPALMDPAKYFAARDQPPPRATVTIGGLDRADTAGSKATQEQEK